MDARSQTCTIELDTAHGTLAIDEVALPDFRLATLRAVLGQPDRVEHVAHAGHYEESGADGE